MIIPTSYASRRNLANAYRRGFQAGTIAGLGGVPLAPYEKPRSVQAYGDGFKAGQTTKDGCVEPTLVEKTRESELLAFLDQLRKDIDAVLLGGVR